MAYEQLKNTAPSGSGAATPTIENRREERFAVEGTVSLILDQDGLEAVDGRLADVSRSGFKAVHQSQHLAPGKVVRFQFEDQQRARPRSGWARIVWSRFQNSMVESGCYIVIED